MTERGTSGLDRLLAPRSVAVVGASPRKGHFANQPLVNLRRFGFDGEVFPVNPHHAEVEGWPCFSSVAELPAPPDLAVVAVPAPAVNTVLEECGKVGIGAAIVVASGFAELHGEEHEDRQSELVRIAREYDIRVCGPNALGIANWADGIVPFGSGNVPEIARGGNIAVVSQSGGLGFTIVNRAWARGAGIGHLAVAGNEADVTIPELIEWHLRRSDVQVVLCYMEAIRDAEGLRRAGELAREVDKPIFILKSGRTARGQRAAAAHTGALATSDRVCDAALRQWGFKRVATLDGLVCAGVLSARFGRPMTRGIGVYCQGGGMAVVAADALATNAVALPPLAPSTVAEIRAILPDASPDNPFDSGGQFLSQGPEPLIAALDIFASDPAIGAVTAFIMPTVGARASVYTEAIVEAASRGQKPFLVVQVSAGELTSPITARLHEAGVLTLEPLDASVEALAAWSSTAEIPALPVELRYKHAVSEAETAIFRERVAAGSAFVPEHEVAAVLQGHGVKFARHTLVTTSELAAAVARDFDGPLVVKVASPDIAHRSDIGAVKINVDVSEAGSAFRDVTENARESHPEASILGATIAELVPQGIELIIAAVRDPVFGVVLTLGFGGTLAELHDDVAVAVLPAQRDEIAALLGSLRGAKLLDGYRGSPPVGLEPILDLVEVVRDVACTLGDALLALELNPVMVYPYGASPIVVDALIELRPEARSGHEDHLVRSRLVERSAEPLSA